MKKLINLKYIKTAKIFLTILVFTILSISAFNNFHLASAFVEIQPPSDGSGGSGGYTPNGSTIYMKFFAVACDSLSDLPQLDNSHASYKIGQYKVVEKGSPDITEAYLYNTFLPSHPNCKTEDGWSFRYGKGVNNPPYTTTKYPFANYLDTAPTSNGVAVAQQPTSYLSDKWVEDYNDPKNSGGAPSTYEEQNSTPFIATTAINEPRIYVSMLRGPGSTSDFYVGPSYVPFSTYNNPPPWVSQTPGTELRCYDNHAGYGNYAYIRLPQGGITYTCILFAAKLPQAPSATIKVNANTCPTTWNITPGNYSNPTTSYSVAPGSYTLVATLPPNYNNLTVTNDASPGGTNTMGINSGEIRTFSINCVQNDAPPIVDGGWSAWSTPGACSTNACGASGTRPQTRTCTNPTPSNGGANCVGPSTQNVVTCTNVACNCTVGTYGPCSVTACGQTGTKTASVTGGGSCPTTDTQSCSNPACPVENPTLPACTVDTFPNDTEYNGVVYPTWTTSNSNNVVLSGGPFGSGVSVEPDGSRGINISSPTTLTVTANAGASCSPSASKSAIMYPESTPQPPVEPPIACIIKDPYTNGDGFPDVSETGDGYANVYWFGNANDWTLSGGPWSNTPFTATNGYGSTVWWNVPQTTQLTLSGNGGQCTDTAWVYAAPAAPTPPNFTATPGACGTGQISLSWGQSAGANGYQLFRADQNGAIYSGGAYGNPAYVDTTGLTPGQTYSYNVISNSPNGNSAPASATAVAPAASCATITGTLTPAAPSCTIPLNGNSCTVNFSWTTTPSNTTPASKVTSDVNDSGNSAPNTIMASTNSGGPTPFTIPYPGRNFYLYNSAQKLAERSAGAGNQVTASCASGTWNGTSCAPVYATPTVYTTPASGTFLTADPTTIYPGGSSTLTWGSSSTSCNGTKFDTVPLGSNHGSTLVYPIVTTTYTLNCSNPAATASVTVIVKKKPTIIEN